MRRRKISLGVLALICAVCFSARAQDPGWPRKLVKPGGTVLIYQPQVDDWQNFIDIKWRPTVRLLNPTTAAAQAKVMYTGEPQFAPIEGTTPQYATNTPDKVIQVGDLVGAVEGEVGAEVGEGSGIAGHNFDHIINHLECPAAL